MLSHCLHQNRELRTLMFIVILHTICLNKFLWFIAYKKIVVHSTSDAKAMTDSDKPQFLNENNLFAYDMFNESLSFAF